MAEARRPPGVRLVFVPVDAPGKLTDCKRNQGKEIACKSTAHAALWPATGHYLRLLAAGEPQALASAAGRKHFCA